MLSGRNRIVKILWMLLTWTVAIAAGTQASALNLPRRFSVEVVPAIRQANHQQDAVIYHFDGDRVSARWETHTQAAAKSGDVTRLEMTTQMEGTFRNGVLKGEQTSVMQAIPPANYSKHHPGGPVTQMFYRGVIEGTLQPDGRIKARVTTTLTGYKALLTEPGWDDAPPTHRWVDQQLPDQPPGIVDYWIDLPTDVWFNTRFVQASGDQSFRLRSALERLDRYMNEASQNLLAGKHALAGSQIGTIRAEVADLQKSIRSGGQDTRIAFKGLPTDDAVLQHLEMQFMMDKWKEKYTIVNESLSVVQTQLADLRNLLSTNVFKSIIKNYISWSNSIPTDVVSGIAGYSTITGIADLPRGFLGWYEAGQKDAGILNDQFRNKRALEEAERFYEQERQNIIDARRKVADQLKAIDTGRLMDLDRSLQQFFTSQRWAGWQAEPRRSEALARLNGSPNR
jgi:hypothetical protein